MDSIIQRIKTTINLVELIAETFTITGNGRIRSTQEHDSLKIWTTTNTWYWFSRGVGGDCLDWYQLIHNCDLAAAIDALAQRAGIQRRPPTPEEQQARTHQQQHHRILKIAAEHYNRTLLFHPHAQAARAYCARRGWSQEVIRSEQIGCTLPTHSPSPSMGEDGRGSSDNALLSPGLAALLREENLLDHPTARAVLSIPHDMIVYVHRDGGRVQALSARSITGKRHYHLPDQPTPPYYNRHTIGADGVILVEGQADAIALAALGAPAVALCGLSNEPPPVPIAYLGLDNDEPGLRRALEIARALDPLLPIVIWEGKDAGEFLERGATPGLLAQRLQEARPALLLMAARARDLSGDLRIEAQRQVLDAYLGLDELVAADLKPALADALRVGIGQLNRLIKARQEERRAAPAVEEHDSPERYVYSAGGAAGGHIWEQCVTCNPDGSAVTGFAVRDPNGAISMRASLDLAGVTYIPYPAQTGVIQAQVVLFPERPEPYHNQRSLIRGIQSFIHTYLDIDPFYEKLAAYYVLFTWVYDLFDTLPYLRALGDYGTGKTRFLQTIGVLCYRPMFVTGASSVSPIFRLIDMFKGTLIIDEADFSNSDAESEIIKILNVGYYSKGVVLRSEKDPATNGSEQWSPQVYRVFGPKILGSRRPFTDRATESRCLTLRMTTARPRPDIPYILGPEFWADATRLRNQLLQYRLEHWRPVAVDSSLADESVEPRLNQVTMALKSLVDTGTRGEIDQFIRAYNATLISDRQMTIPAIIVQALAEIHQQRATDLMGQDARDFTMKGIAEKARELASEIDPDIKIHPRTVSKILSEELGLPRRRTDPRTRRAALEYDEDELIALMKRYGIDIT